MGRKVRLMVKNTQQGLRIAPVLDGLVADLYTGLSYMTHKTKLRIVKESNTTKSVGRKNITHTNKSENAQHAT